MTEFNECRDRECSCKKFRVAREDMTVWELKCTNCGTVQLVYKTWLEPTLLELGWCVQ